MSQHDISNIEMEENIKRITSIKTQFQRHKKPTSWCVKTNRITIWWWLKKHFHYHKVYATTLSIDTKQEKNEISCICQIYNGIEAFYGEKKH